MARLAAGGGQIMLGMSTGVGISPADERRIGLDFSVVVVAVPIILYEYEYYEAGMH